MNRLALAIKFYFRLNYSWHVAWIAAESHARIDQLTKTIRGKK